jgi:hypothetical protein
MSDYQSDPPRRRRPPEPGPRRRPRRPRPDDDYGDNYDDDYDDDQPEAVETFIPYRNPLALTAYYLGVFGLIPCVGLALGPAALICGIIGVRRARENPRARGVGHAVTGIVLGTLTCLANYGAVLFVLVAYLVNKK